MSRTRSFKFDNDSKKFYVNEKEVSDGSSDSPISANLSTTAQANITTIGTLGNLTVTNTVTLGNIVNGGADGVGNIGASADKFNSVHATNLYGTLQTAAQTNITSVGTLSALTVNGATVLGNSSGVRLRSVESGGVIYIQAGNGVSNSANTITFAPWTQTASTMSIDIANRRVGVKKAAPTVELDVDGAGAFTGNVSAGNLSATNLTGTIQTAAQPSITSLGTLTSLTMGGNITLATVGSRIFGEFSNSTQLNRVAFQSSVPDGDTTLTVLPNGTSQNAAINLFSNSNPTNSSTLTLQSLSSEVRIGSGGYGSGADVPVSIRVGAIERVRIETNGLFDVKGNLRVNTNNNAIAIINGGTAGVGNIGASGQGFNTVFAKATSAQYADLAEIYTSDRDYVPGTVVIFGGEKEVTVSTESHDPRVAGVVSTNPAYLMNNACDGVEVALQGRVPCKVLGPVAKGDRLVSSSTQGAAQRLSMSYYQPGCIIGKALESVPEGEIATIEVVVGRV